MRFLRTLILGCLLLIGSSNAAESSPAAAQIKVVPATDSLIRKAAAQGKTIARLLDAAQSSIGVPYKWGGTELEKGIDCSNYTWQLFRAIGLPYDRFVSTMALSRLQRENGLQSIAFKDAEAADILVYGYRDDFKKWRGHVVILVDKNGSSTGHKGLVLGAHGKPVSAVQFVTFAGFEDGYFKDPKMRLCNVLRVDNPRRQSENEALTTPLDSSP